MPANTNPSKPRVSKPAIFMITLIVLYLGFSVFCSIYTNILWFKELGYSAVFFKILWTKIGIACAFSLFLFAMIWINIRVAIRGTVKPYNVSNDVIDINENLNLRKTTPSLLLLSLVISFVVGSGVASYWQEIVTFLNGVPFGIKDPIFDKDISFYVFTLPILEFLNEFLFKTIFFCLIATGGGYVLTQLSSLKAGQRLQFNSKIIRHLTILLGVLALWKSFQYWTDRFGLLYSQHHNWYGAFYTDIHARLLAMNVLMGLSGVLGLILIFNAIFSKWKTSTWKLPLVGVIIWFITAFIMNGIFPGIMQKFIVSPNEINKEAPYLAYNIKFTNQAFQLENITESNFPITENLTKESIAKNAPTIRNIRLWDYRPLKETFKQIQVIRQYYDFHDVDIDRYTLSNNEYAQVMLSAREILIPPTARSWTNEKMVYTHGYGVAMSRVNAVEKEGLPKLLVKDIPPVGPAELKITRPEIYFGETQQGYVLVNTLEKEFDYPKGNDNVYSIYSGKAGIPAGSGLRRMIFSYYFGGTDLFFTSRLTNDSKIIYRRDIMNRVKTLFPFLTYDEDPYLVIQDGKLVWILDGFTETDRYPYSKPYNHYNYLRNSVKITIDAYNGTVTAYMMDPKDPIIQTWAKVFPGIFKPMSQMPEELVKHLRYPEKLFLAQASIYSLYHMREPQVFYNREDKWAIPMETFDNQQQLVEPYYAIMRLPGEAKEEFMMMIPFTPDGKNNMIGWMAAKCDAPDYGKMIVYKFPKDKLVYGPQQIEARIDQDPVISPQLSLWNQQGSRVFRGNLLVIPIEESILYVEPLYLKSEQSQIPELKRVVVAYGERIAMESTLEDALVTIFGGKPITPTNGELASDTTLSKQTKTETVKPAASLRDTAREASQAYEKAQQKLKAGDWSGYGEEMKKLQNLLKQMERM